MPIITNKKYRDFLDKGLIKTINIEELTVMLNKIKHKHQQEAKILVITMYYTGARPAEILNLTAGDIEKEGNSYIVITTQALKKGLVRQIRLRIKAKHVTEIHKYSKARPENMYLFPHFRSKTKTTITYKTRKGEQKTKQYEYKSNGLNYWFTKWFEGEINPYYLRHNRFSKVIAEGGTMEQIMILKGSKTIDSVRPYMHLSKEKSKEIAKKIK